MSTPADLLERFRGGAHLVEQALDGLAESEIDYHPSPEAWSVRQLMAHLADSEVVAAWRFRRLIADHEPALEAFDEKRWAAHLGYDRRDTFENLASFRRLRAENYGLLSYLPADAFDRAGTHAERGRVTLRDMVMINVTHAERHADQIRRVRNSFRISKSETK